MEENQFENTMSLVESFTKKREALKEKAPFHFNVLDEAKTNENSHSKMIGKLLRYKDNGSLVHLKSFLQHLNLELTVCEPEIRVEKERIDISIIDKDFAIIIENKIHYAKDQNEQIKRYIQKIKNKGYSIDQIYVIYLTRWGGKKATEESFPTKLREDIGDRYVEVNFNSNILPWLKEDVLPICKQKDKDLIYGLEQYIDHLEGLLHKRIKDKKMNEELNKLFNEKLKLKKDVNENDRIISEKIEHLKSCKNHLDGMKEKLRNKLRSEFLELLHSKLNDLEAGWSCVTEVHNKSSIDRANWQYFGFKNDIYKFEDSNLVFSVEIQNWRNFICGIYGQDEEQRNKLINLFKPHHGVEMKKHGDWVSNNLNNYTYKETRLADYVYDDQWNQFYANDLEGITNMFFEEIKKVYGAWKEICENKKR